MIGRFLISLANKAGYDLSFTKKSEQSGHDLAEEGGEKIRLVRAHTMLPHGRLLSLYQQSVFCEIANIPGSFVECGTWKGGAIGLMALANQAYAAERRHLHLFDSFEGVPEPDQAVDGAEAQRLVQSVGAGVEGRLIPVKGLYDTERALEACRELLEEKIGYDANYVHYHKGWFQHTLPRDSAEVGPIAILRLDGDWYESTRICLEYLYDKVVPGGFVIIDDYGWYEGCKKAVDEFMKRENINAFLSTIDNAGRYWIKP